MRIHIVKPADVRHESEIVALFETLKKFEIVKEPSDAQAIVFLEDSPASVRKSLSFSKYPERCIALREGDACNYFLPTIYTGNSKNVLGMRRSHTISYYTYLLESPDGKRNGWLSKYRNVNVDKKYLYSFMGGSTSFSRKRIFNYAERVKQKDVLIESTDHYRHWDSNVHTEKREMQRRYVAVMKESKFVLCPRGASPGSIRLFEAMELGCAPIVISDGWLPVGGLDWSFCLFVKEKELKNLDSIVRRHEAEWRWRGDLASKAYAQHFGIDGISSTLERQIADLLQQRNGFREALVHRVVPAVMAFSQCRAYWRDLARTLILSLYRVFGLKFPFKLNR